MEITTRFRTNLLSLKHIGLDSMCFIYHLSKNPKYSPLTKIVFSLLEEKKISAVTSMITATEVFVQAERSQNKLILLEYDKFFHAFPNLVLSPIDWYVGRLAARLRAKYSALKTPDALQIASAILNDCKGFITNDNKLKQVKEIKVLTFDEFC